MGAKGCGKTRIMGIVNSKPHKDAHMVTLYKARETVSMGAPTQPYPHTSQSLAHVVCARRAPNNVLGYSFKI